MNKSSGRPQLHLRSLARVENPGAASTGCERSNPSLTRGFFLSSTIHTPYYDYEIHYIQRGSRREGTTCAYPS